MNFMSAFVLAIAVVVGGFLVGGRYESHMAGQSVVMVDRYLGGYLICNQQQQCKKTAVSY